MKPEFAHRILEGTKRYEYRRRVFMKPVETVVVYASSPHRRIVGEMKVAGIHSAPPSTIWRRTRATSGIPYSYFRDYFGGRVEAHAIEVASVTAYEEPVDPYRLFPRFVPPQSYVYLDDGDVAQIREAALQLEGVAMVVSSQQHQCSPSIGNAHAPSIGQRCISA